MSRPKFVLNSVNTDDCPCNGCNPPKRQSGCHGVCNEYIDWDSEHRKKLADRQRVRSINDVYYTGAQRRNKDIMQKGTKLGRNSHGTR